jgi:hypothetical protein
MRKHPLVALSACSLLAVGGMSVGLGTATGAGPMILSRSVSPAAKGSPLAGRQQRSIPFGLQSFLATDALFAADFRHPAQPVSPTTVNGARAAGAALIRSRELRDAAAAADARRAAEAHARYLAAEKAAAVAVEQQQAAAEAAAEAAQQQAAAAAAAQAAAAAAAAANAAKSSHGSAPPAGGVWSELRDCESGGNYAEDTGNGYYGAYQFALSTWYGLGFSGLPSDASPATQDEAAQMLQARSGWGQWPACSYELGLI